MYLLPYLHHTSHPMYILPYLHHTSHPMYMLTYLHHTSHPMYMLPSLHHTSHPMYKLPYLHRTSHPMYILPYLHHTSHQSHLCLQRPSHNCCSSIQNHWPHLEHASKYTHTRSISARESKNRPAYYGEPKYYRKCFNYVL